MHVFYFSKLPMVRMKSKKGYPCHLTSHNVRLAHVFALRLYSETSFPMNVYLNKQVLNPAEDYFIVKIYNTIISIKRLNHCTAFQTCSVQ